MDIRPYTVMVLTWVVLGFYLGIVIMLWGHTPDIASMIVMGLVVFPALAGYLILSATMIIYSYKILNVRVNDRTKERV